MNFSANFAAWGGHAIHVSSAFFKTTSLYKKKYLFTYERRRKARTFYIKFNVKHILQNPLDTHTYLGAQYNRAVGHYLPVSTRVVTARMCDE
jgi:hypothetical protein